MDCGEGGWRCRDGCLLLPQGVCVCLAGGAWAPHVAPGLSPRVCSRPIDRLTTSLLPSLPQLSLAGLEAAKKRLFSQQAPVPIEVITPLQSKEGSTKERPMYFREVSFKVGTNKLAIRQEWVILLSGGKPLIGSVSASRVSPNRSPAPA